MFKITCSAYRITSPNQLGEYRLKIKSRCLKSESGFVDAVELKLRSFYATENGIINAWTEHNGTMVPDVSVDTKDVFTIEPINE